MSKEQQILISEKYHSPYISKPLTMEEIDLLEDNIFNGRKYCRKRVAYRVRANSIGIHTKEQWLELCAKYNFRCCRCGCEVYGDTPNKDHIISAYFGGSSDINNLQPLCKQCNSKKGVAIISFRDDMVIDGIPYGGKTSKLNIVPNNPITIEIEALKKVFNLFTVYDKNHPTLEKPLKQSGRYYASDLNSMIFIDADKAPLGYEEKLNPICSSVIPRVVNCCNVINIAELEKQLIPDIVPAIVKCTECEALELVPDAPCVYCDDTREVPDPKGGEMIDQYKEWALFGVVFYDKQLRRLLNACKLLEVNSITMTYRGVNKQPNLFICGDITIMIMPGINKVSNPTKLNF